MTNSTNEKTLYQCPKCGYVTSENGMDADAHGDNVSDEIWSNWICPSCKTWWDDLDDWIKLSD